MSKEYLGKIWSLFDHQRPASCSIASINLSRSQARLGSLQRICRDSKELRQNNDRHQGESNLIMWDCHFLGRLGRRDRASLLSIRKFTELRGEKNFREGQSKTHRQRKTESVKQQIVSH